jgi:subtilisin family serine protease
MISISRSFALLPLAVLLAGPAAGQNPAAGTEPRELGPQALSQLAQIMREKSARTPAQQKLATALVYAVRERAADQVMQGLPHSRPAFQKDRTDRLEVDLKADVTPGLLQAIEEEGGSVVSTFPEYRAVRAFLPLAALERIAVRDEVRHIKPAAKPIVWSFGDKKVNTSQGDVAHAAAQARATFGVDGTGVKVGVLSDSVDPAQLASLGASGDLPASVTVLAAGSGNSEGTAMLEIVHDLAPGAQLFFATANGGEAAFANNITALKNQGCKVIVDDISYLAEAVFQDGVIAQAVSAASAAGVAYFSSAGNSGNLTRGAAGTWEGNFKVGGSATLGVFTNGTIHDFGGGVTMNTLTAVPVSPAPIILEWSDAFDHSGADYDLCLVNAAGTLVLDCSADVQNGDDDPLEGVTPQAGARVVIVNFLGTQPARFLHLSGNRSRFQVATRGQIAGHSAEASAFSIAAVDVATAAGGAFTGGGQNPVETFSSDGPRRIFYTAAGTPITPGNLLATGGTLRQKPDFAAADGVAVATTGFNPFFGTSAAAPHAAAIAALMLDRNPTLTPASLRTALQAGSLDIMAAGVDSDSGSGVLSANLAVGAAGTASACVRDADTACLQSGRFQVEVDWQTATSQGKAQVMEFGGQRAENDESVFWWFFSPTNFEMGVKVLNACIPALGNKYWVFASGLTDQKWTLRVLDTQTGAMKSYTNNLNHLSTTFADVAAFNCL